MKTNKFILAALAALVLAACSKDNENQPRSSFPEDGIVRVTAGVSDIATRAGIDNTNITGKEIGFFLWKPYSEEVYAYDNVKLTHNGSEWTPDKTMYWKDKTTEVFVLAYAPWQDGVLTDEDSRAKLNWITPTDQSTPEKLEAADLVYQLRPQICPDRTGEYGLTADGKIEFKLLHTLTKIQLHLTIGTDVTDETPDAEITSVLIRGLREGREIDMANMGFGMETDFNTLIDITPCPVGNGVYEAIFTTQRVSAGQFSVEVTLSNGKTYVYTLSDEYYFDDGTLYKLPIQVGTSTPKVAFPKTGITATSWGAENSLGDKITN